MLRFAGHGVSANMNFFTKLQKKTHLTLTDPAISDPLTIPNTTYFQFFFTFSTQLTMLAFVYITFTMTHDIWLDPDDPKPVTLFGKSWQLH